jgi:hypothetical protein
MKRINTKSRIVNLKMTKIHKNDTKPIHSLQFQAIATRPPIGTDIHRPVIINVKRFLIEKV